MFRISIIVPVYQVEAYLPQCVDSILAQSFDSFEVLLVDDGSTDNCPAMCDAYAQADSRVRVIHQKNAGLSAARNTGINHARGEYLCFIDSDDILSTEYCNLLHQAAAETGCKMAACRMERFTDGQFSPGDIAEGTVMAMPFTEFLEKQMGGEIEIGVCNRLFHRSVFEKIRFMPGRLHEDIIFAGDLLEQEVGDVAYVDASLYYYRQRANSIVNQQANSAKCSPDRIFAGDYLLQQAEKTGYVYMEECLFYAVQYPWFFVDPIYVRFRFRENMEFLNALQKIIRSHRNSYRKLPLLGDIQRRRMILFSYSKILYGFNAYARLCRVYLYHILKRDAYTDGHGI